MTQSHSTHHCPILNEVRKIKHRILLCFCWISDTYLQWRRRALWLKIIGHAMSKGRVELSDSRWFELAPARSGTWCSEWLAEQDRIPILTPICAIQSVINIASNFERTRGTKSRGRRSVIDDTWSHPFTAYTDKGHQQEVTISSKLGVPKGKIFCSGPSAAFSKTRLESILTPQNLFSICAYSPITHTFQCRWRSMVYGAWELGSIDCP